MNKIIYPKIEEYNKGDSFYDYTKNYIKQFKNKKDLVEISYLCAKETIELIKENKELYEKCIKGLNLVELWLKDENSINIQELKEIADSISYLVAYSAYFSIYSIYYSADSIYYSVSSIYFAYKAKPELLPYIQKLIQLYLRTEKQFNIEEHNNTYYESILKQIVNTEYEKLEEIDKNQTIDIINEHYNIEIQQMDFLVHKLIYREFVENEKFDNI